MPLYHGLPLIYQNQKIAIQETQAPLAALCRRLQALRRQQATPHLAAVQQLQLTRLALETPPALSQPPRKKR